MTSYHELHITTATIARTSIFNLPYRVRVQCCRLEGWTVYANKEDHLPAELLGGEFDGPGLRLDVCGFVICDSLTPKPDGSNYRRGQRVHLGGRASSFEYITREEFERRMGALSGTIIGGNAGKLAIDPGPVQHGATGPGEVHQPDHRSYEDGEQAARDNWQPPDGLGATGPMCTQSPPLQPRKSAPDPYTDISPDAHQAIFGFPKPT